MVNRFKWNNGCAAKTGSTVGFWAASIRCGTTRDALFAGTRRESISRSANKLKRESKKKMWRCERKSITRRCSRKSLVRRKRSARYWRKSQKWRRWIRRFSFWVRPGRARSLSLGPFTSDRNVRRRAFIRVDCAAIPTALIASELFGHEKGAFTGALQRHLGRFELADGGTIFLDEIGELPAETQSTLLRVLQEREFERVGGSQPISVDVRVLAATNRDLKAAVAAGTFRQDLFYRLNVFPIQVPPLRQRADDIHLLVEYLIDRHAKKFGKKIRKIEKKTLELFQTYKWPGNVRELQNVVERAVILCDDDTFSVDETWLIKESPREPRSLSASASRLLRLDEDQEREMIEAALAESKGRVAGPFGAAVKLGIPRQTLESKIVNLGINKNRFKSA